MPEQDIDCGHSAELAHLAMAIAFFQGLDSRRLPPEGPQREGNTAPGVLQLSLATETQSTHLRIAEEQ